MNFRPLELLPFIILFGCFGNAISGDTSTEDSVSSASDALTGDIDAGEERYNQSCNNCHGAAGKGVASYPKISGKDISYTIEKLETYRDGIKIGPNSSLMIMMAKPLTDEEILNLSAYLEVAAN
ncbi:MAG: c-type cytochrome [Gammaproteobacteria bacterium]|nr:c-type cytochrome [Gammaproteobacteria bacterium]